MTAEGRHEALLYMVGERGPETFRPTVSGVVIRLRADPPTILETPDDPPEDDPLDVPTDPVTSEEPSDAA